MSLNIRLALESDFEDIWKIFHSVVERGDTYAYNIETTREQASSIWMSAAVRTYVACVDGDRVAGTYILKPNQQGPGAHVANAGYMVSDEYSGRGIGKAMCLHSLDEARSFGFEAMQFNSVVSTNHAAIHLWLKMGFSIVGTVPRAFRQRELGLVDIYVMHRFL
jgi:L-amino acid N-acyltransferase YncA